MFKTARFFAYNNLPINLYEKKNYSFGFTKVDKKFFA